MGVSNDLRKHILGLVAEYHESEFGAAPFVPGETAVPVSGKVFEGHDQSILEAHARRGQSNERESASD